MEEQKVLNVQTNQKIEAVESSLNKKLDIMHSEISRLSNQQQGSEKGNFPSQTQQNPKGVHEIGSASDPLLSHRHFEKRKIQLTKLKF